MRNLILFLIKNNHWFLFIILEVASFVLLVRFNDYRQGVYFTSANAIVGEVYKTTDEVFSYFALRETNKLLLDKTAALEKKVFDLQAALHAAKDSFAIQDFDDTLKYSLSSAKVIRNSINLADNYITLNKGKLDGVRPEMGVVDARGVVGIVYLTSNHYSLVISLLNSKSNISCKIKNSNYFGYLKWERNDPEYAYFKDLPRHAVFHVGDTIVTSGYSSVFPPGLMIGKIAQVSDSQDGMSFMLKIKLATEFGHISDVYLISRGGRDEERILEQRVQK